jgi:hypothetical protein
MKRKQLSAVLIFFAGKLNTLTLSDSFFSLHFAAVS